MKNEAVSRSDPAAVPDGETGVPTAPAAGPSEVSRLVVMALIGVCCAIWGSTWLVIRHGIADVPPFTAAALRFLLAVPVMSGVAALLARREGGVAPPWWLSAVMGTLNIGASFGIVYWSEQFLPSGLASILWGTFPILMAISSHRFLPGERLSLRHGFGFPLGFAGVVVLFATDIRDIGPDAVKGACVLLASPLVVAVGTTLVKRHGGGVSSLLLNRNAIIIGAVWLSLLALLFERDAPMHFTRGAVLSIVYLSLFGTVVTFGLYYWLLRHVKAYRMSMIPYVTPVIAVVLGALVDHDPVSWATLAGMALILGGIGLAAK